MYFENGFACRIRLSNAGSNEQSYGPVPENYREHPATYRRNFPSDIVIVISKFL